MVDIILCIILWLSYLLSIYFKNSNWFLLIKSILLFQIHLFQIFCMRILISIVFGSIRFDNLENEFEDIYQ